jgi:hypothetical protein
MEDEFRPNKLELQFKQVLQFEHRVQLVILLEQRAQFPVPESMQNVLSIQAEHLDELVAQDLQFEIVLAQHV